MNGDGPPSRDHDWLVRETAELWAKIGNQPDYPRGCGYLRVPLRLTDPKGPGIDCHWDNHRNALICFMDIEDGPLPAEWADAVGFDATPQGWTHAFPAGTKKQ